MKIDRLLAIVAGSVVMFVLHFIFGQLFEVWFLESITDNDIFTDMRALSSEIPVVLPGSGFSTIHIGSSESLMFFYLGISIFLTVGVSAYVAARVAKQAKILCALVMGIIYMLLMLFNSELTILIHFPFVLTGLVFLVLSAAYLGGFVDKKLGLRTIGTLSERG